MWVFASENSINCGFCGKEGKLIGSICGVTNVHFKQLKMKKGRRIYEAQTFGPINQIHYVFGKRSDAEAV